MWIREVASVVGVDERILLDGMEEGFEEMLKGSKSVADSEEDEECFDPHAPPPYTTLLAFSLPNLPLLLSTLITNYPPFAFPSSRRSAPSNAIYLFARFALYHCDTTWLEELIVGVVDTVERGVLERTEDVAFLGFWMWNVGRLLGLLRGDAALEGVCEEEGLLGLVEELGNAIHGEQ